MSKQGSVNPVPTVLVVDTSDEERGRDLALTFSAAGAVTFLVGSSGQFRIEGAGSSGKQESRADVIPAEVDLLVLHNRNIEEWEDLRSLGTSADVVVKYTGASPPGDRGWIQRPVEAGAALSDHDASDLIEWISEGAPQEIPPRILQAPDHGHFLSDELIALDILCQGFLALVSFEGAAYSKDDPVCDALMEAPDGVPQPPRVTADSVLAEPATWFCVILADRDGSALRDSAFWTQVAIRISTWDLAENTHCPHWEEYRRLAQRRFGATSPSSLLNHCLEAIARLVVAVSTELEAKRAPIPSDMLEDWEQPRELAEWHELVLNAHIGYQVLASLDSRAMTV